jgi:hypothetical protein
MKIGGVGGLAARLTGKQAPDIQAWVLGDDAPAFVRSDGPLSPDGPIWRMELAVPVVLPDSTAAVRSQNSAARVSWTCQQSSKSASSYRCVITSFPGREAPSNGTDGGE